MADMIISGGTIVTMNPAGRVIEDGAVAVTAGRIVAVGRHAEIAAAHSAPQTIDAAVRLVMPGMIDVHAHAGHALIKTMGMEQHSDWEAICGDVYTTGPTAEFWYAEARLAALERLRFGVTCGVSLLGGGDTIMRTDDPVYADAHCTGVAEVGTRSVVAIGPTRAPHPRTCALWEGDTRHDYPISFEQQLDPCSDVLSRWHGAHDGRLNIALLYPVLRDEHEARMPAADYAQAVRQVQAVRALSREAGTVFTQDGHWKGSVTRADKLGQLGPEGIYRTRSFSATTRLLSVPLLAHGSRTTGRPSPRSWGAVQRSRCWKPGLRSPSVRKHRPGPVRRHVPPDEIFGSRNKNARATSSARS